MQTSHSARCHILVLALGLTATAATAEEPKKPKAAAAKVPERIVITDDAPAQPEPTPLGPARPMTTLDASGTRRAPGEPRMITGSFIPQKFDVYANDTNAAIPLQVFTASDIAAKGKGFGGSAGAVAPNYTDSTSPTATRPAASSEPEFVHVRTRHTLDLRTVEPARRLEVATQILSSQEKVIR